MTDIKFDIEKITVNAPVRILKTTWSMKEIDLPKWEKIPQIKVDPNEWNVYSVLVGPVTDWIHSQPLDMWNQDTTYPGGAKLRYRFSPELEAWFLLRWS